MNWRDRPLTSHEVIAETIAATTTTAGLTAQAALDTSTYQKGIKISDKDMQALEQRSIRRHDFHDGVELHPGPRPAADTPDITEINLRRALSADFREADSGQLPHSATGR